jgi:hypothetical protein
MNKSIIVVLLLLFSSFLLNSINCQDHSLTIRPVIGIRGHSNGLPIGLAPGGKPLLITAPMLGFDLSLGQRFSFSVQKDWNVTVIPYNDIPLFGHTLNETWTENSFLLRYGFLKKYATSIGYYFMRKEGSLNHDLGSSVSRDFKGLLLSVSKQYDWLNIELRTKINLSPYFDALIGAALYSVVFSHQIGKTPKETNSFNDKFQLNALLGMRFFPIKGVYTIQNEEFGKIGIAPTFGLELLHRKHNLSFNIEKDVWFSFNGGSSKREIKGQIASSLVGFRYHLELKNNRYMRFGLGYSLISDLDKRALVIDGSPYNLKGLYHYQVKGIGASLSYEFMKNGDLELKHTFPIKSLGEPLFNPIRFSGGIIYRLYK